MNSKYDDQLHVAVPTTDFIRDNTGYDPVLEDGNKERAEAKLRALTAKAKNYLYMDKPYETQNVISYLIRFNDDWLHAWEQYVARYVEATFMFGDESAWKETPRTIKQSAYGGLLGINRFTQAILAEVRTSDEEW